MHSHLSLTWLLLMHKFYQVEIKPSGNRVIPPPAFRHDRSIHISELHVPKILLFHFRGGSLKLYGVKSYHSSYSQLVYRATDITTVPEKITAATTSEPFLLPDQIQKCTVCGHSWHNKISCLSKQLILHLKLA